MQSTAEICRFAGEYLAQFLAPESSAEALSSHFAAQCAALGFSMDDGAAFRAAFPDGNPFVDAADFKAVAPKIKDISLLGSAILSHFHHVTLWEGPAGLTRNAHRSWFAAALSRLVELTRPTGKSQVILFPAVNELREEIETLREELSDLLEQQGQLLFQTIPNLDAAYQVAFGSLEYEIYSAECSMRRLRRKTELIRAQLNRSEKVSLDRIEARLDEEFAEYKTALQEQLERYAAGLARCSADRLTLEQTNRLRKCYRRIVKALHPDLHPDQTQVQKDLFVQACAAYETGNLEAMESIFVLVEGGRFDDSTPLPDTLSALREQRMILIERIGSVRKSMDELKAQYPCSKAELLADATAKEAYIAELKEALCALREQERYYNEQLKALLLTVQNL